MKTTGIPDASAPRADPASPSAGAASARDADLTWLLHRAAQRMRAALDNVARAHGLAGARDWLVLSAIAAGPPQTQLALAHSLCLDKTTLTSLLDRMEARGYVTRSLDSNDRRARIPSLTPSGLDVQRRMARARDEAEAAVLREFTDDERRSLRDLLTRLAANPSGGSGSCI